MTGNGYLGRRFRLTVESKAVTGAYLAAGPPPDDLRDALDRIRRRSGAH